MSREADALVVHQRLLDALELEVLPTELARNAIATELEHYVEAMDR
jgi:hypothetical protein